MKMVGLPVGKAPLHVGSLRLRASPLNRCGHDCGSPEPDNEADSITGNRIRQATRDPHVGILTKHEPWGLDTCPDQVTVGLSNYRVAIRPSPRR